MGELDDPNATCLMTTVMMLSLNLIFSNEMVLIFKKYFIRRTRASVSSVMSKIGKKLKNYCRMRDMSFWKLHDKMKDQINKAHAGASIQRRSKNTQESVLYAKFIDVLINKVECSIESSRWG